MSLRRNYRLIQGIRAESILAIIYLLSEHHIIEM